MPTITRLQAKGRSAARTCIYLDDTAWEEISSEVVLKHCLSKGRELDAEECESLLAEDAFIRARRAAAILLATRPRAVGEMRSRLRERKFEEATVEETIAYFIDKGDLDDARFARLYAANQFRTKTIGKRKVADSLRRLGVGEGDVEGALDEEEAASDGRQTEMIRRMIERRLPSLRKADRMTRRRKLWGALARAGFEPDLYNPLLNEALEEMESFSAED